MCFHLIYRENQAHDMCIQQDVRVVGDQMDAFESKSRGNEKTLHFCIRSIPVDVLDV